MPLALPNGMIARHSVWLGLAMVLTYAGGLGANSPVNVDVGRGADKAFVVQAAFVVRVPPTAVWAVLTDYEGIGRFVSSIRQSTVKHREAGRVLLEQYGVGKAWIISVPIHVVLDVREDNQRVLAFRDVCGRSFSTYEGKWQLTAIDGGTRVTYYLKADPNGRQPAMIARSAIRDSVTRLLDEVRNEILERTAQ